MPISRAAVSLWHPCFSSPATRCSSRSPCSSTDAMTTSNATHVPRPSYVGAAVVGVIIFALYVLTLAPTTALWDASEYITAAYTLGIPHPPGNPLFVLLGRVASLVPISTVAVRVNMLAAVCSAFSAAVWFLVVERVLSAWFPLRWTRLVGAGVATLLSATAFTVWN